ncbi:sensor histidine kinase [Pseudonocardia sp. CA-107938]|uniref:sensor histidine kinase n=1 Tax=Pseudonocardia sp. CA-107938 TaxID=3240021 RepID=UPI003D8A8C9E
MIDRRSALQRWRRFDVVVRDLPLGLLLSGASFLPALHNHGTQFGGVPDRPFDLLAIGVVALEGLPLAVRRRWPAVCLLLVSVGFALDQLRGYHAVAGTALPIALLSVGAHLHRGRRTTAVLFTAGYLLLVALLLGVGWGEPPEELVTFYLALALAWGVGEWLRSTRAAEAERRRRVADDTRAAERSRIARELHDVVTHHVTAMVVQAEAARYLTAAPERLDQTLTAVSDTGRRAITDLRHLLDLLNPAHGDRDGATMPAQGSLAMLVEQARQAGQPVEFTEEGTPAASSGSADLVAYRVVQEALTNALKHAHGSRTSVQVHHGEREITVEVSTADSGALVPSPGGGGRGLAGLRERVDVLGGDFSADRNGSGFAVRARIPTGNRS